MARQQSLTSYYNPAYLEDIKKNRIANEPERLVVTAAEQLKTGRALDIGCGLGRNAFFLARSGFEVTAFDLSEVAVGYVQQVAARESLRINVGRGNILHERLDSNYNLVNASWVFDELNQLNAHWLVRRMQEATEPGGLNSIVTTVKGLTRGGMRAKGGHHFFTDEELTDLYAREKWEILLHGIRPIRLNNQDICGLRVLAKKPALS